MKKQIILSAIAFTIVFAACNNAADNNASSTIDSTVIAKDTINQPAADTAAFIALDTTKLAAGAAFYQCPMHAAITSDKETTCPECGMDLEKLVKN